MNPSVPVVLATSGLPGEDALVHALDQANGPVTLSRRCLDLADLLGAAATTPVQVALVDVRLRRLDRDAVARLQVAGVAVVLLAAPDDESRARALGADAVVVICVGSVDFDHVTAAVSAAAAQRAASGAPVEPPAAVGDRVREQAPVQHRRDTTPEPVRRGRLIAVWGPVGGPGRTGVALTLADEAARRGLRVWLVDADTTGPALAQRLGLLDDASGLAVATRLAGAGRLTPADLARLAVALPSGLRVLTGLARPERWSELRPAALGVVWEHLVALADLVVVDVGAGLERDDETLLDPGLPSRHGAAVATLGCADAVVAVGAADPVGLVRLVRGLDVVGSAAPTARCRVVVNRVRRSVAGDRAPAQIRKLLDDRLAHEPLLVPDEPAAWDAALFAGLTLAEAAPRSASRAALVGLVDVLVSASPDPSQGPRPRIRRARTTRGAARRRRSGQASASTPGPAGA